MKILHLSDIHIGIENNEEFHEILLNYLISNFSKDNTDYVIVSGDIANKCVSSIEAAEKWISRLHSEMDIDISKFIYCPGNHDLDKNILEEIHDENRLNFQLGRKYIINEYKNTAFDLYNKLLYNVGYNEKIIHEFEDVIFISLNSSWLTQFNSTYYTNENNTINDLLGKGDNSAYSYLHNKYGCAISQKSTNRNLFKNTLNWSENLNQQLALYKKYVPEIESFNNELHKPVIVVFHHPEDHLHLFERYNVDGIFESGQYSEMSFTFKPSALVCGHIHPALKTAGIKKGEFMDMLIGAPAHISKDYRGGPIFHEYDVTSENSQLVIFRNSYFWESKAKIIYNEKENDPIFLNHLFTEAKLNLTKKESHFSLKDETDFKSYKEKTKTVILESLLHNLKLVFNNEVEMEPGFCWIGYEDHDYRSWEEITSFTIRNKYKLDIDIIFCDEGIDRELISARCIARLMASKDKEHYRYAPFFIDIANCFMDKQSIYRLNVANKFDTLRNGMILSTSITENKFEAYTIKNLIEEMKIDIDSCPAIFKMTLLKPYFIEAMQLSKIMNSQNNIEDLTILLHPNNS